MAWVSKLAHAHRHGESQYSKVREIHESVLSRKFLVIRYLESYMYTWQEIWTVYHCATIEVWVFRQVICLQGIPHTGAFVFAAHEKGEHLILWCGATELHVHVLTATSVC